MVVNLRLSITENFLEWMQQIHMFMEYPLLWSCCYSTGGSTRISLSRVQTRHCGPRIAVIENSFQGSKKISNCHSAEMCGKTESLFAAAEMCGKTEPLFAAAEMCGKTESLWTPPVTTDHCTRSRAISTNCIITVWLLKHTLMSSFDRLCSCWPVGIFRSSISAFYRGIS
jgi:hypothetical protein